MALNDNLTTNLGNGFTGGSRWSNGSLQTAAPGYGWDANGNYVNIAQSQLAQQAGQQAQQDLASFGGLTPYQIGMQAASTADPFANQRGQYQNSLQDLMQGKFGPGDPSYDWRFGQGQQALERSQAAKGFLGSGNILQELQNYGQGQASTEYQNQYNRLLPLTGATTGSPGAAGLAMSGLYDWRNNALANLGAANQMQQPQLSGAGSTSNSQLVYGQPSKMGVGVGGSSGSSNYGSGGGSSGGGSFGSPSMPSSPQSSMGYDPAYSDAMARRQQGAMGGGGSSGGASGGGSQIPIGAPGAFGGTGATGGGGQGPNGANGPGMGGGGQERPLQAWDSDKKEWYWTTEYYDPSQGGWVTKRR